MLQTQNLQNWSLKTLYYKPQTHKTRAYKSQAHKPRWQNPKPINPNPHIFKLINPMPTNLMITNHKFIYPKPTNAKSTNLEPTNSKPTPSCPQIPTSCKRKAYISQIHKPETLKLTHPKPLNPSSQIFKIFLPLSAEPRVTKRGRGGDDSMFFFVIFD